MESEVQNSLKMKEILNTSIHNFDLKNEAKISTIKKLLGNEMNNFHFYDIPIENDITATSNKRSKNLIPSFKSIHKLGGIKVLSNVQKNYMNNASIYESNIRSQIPNNVMILGDIYKKMNIEKSEKEVHRRQSITLTNENSVDEEAFSTEIDLWEKKFKKLHNDKKLKSQITIHTKSKSYSMKPIDKSNKNKFTLPSLVQNNVEKLDFEKKYSVNQEALFKKFRKEIYIDETFRKLITRYAKFNANFDRNQESAERLPLKEDSSFGSLDELKKEIHSFFSIRLEEHSSTIIEKTNYLEQIRFNIERKFQKKIHDSEAYVNNKQMNSILLRKENSYIIAKMSKIKHLILELHFTIMNSNLKNGELNKPINFRKSVRAQSFIPHNGKEASAMLRKGTIGKFIEKTIETKNKEKELLSLKNNYANFEEKIQYNRELLSELESDFKKEKLNLKEINYLRRLFLINLLKQGLDCGLDEGISWIVRTLWGLGYEIKLSNLPEFLDAKGKDFILNKARLEKELREFETMSRISIEIYLSNSKKHEPFEKETMEKGTSNYESQINTILSPEEGEEILSYKTSFIKDKNTLNDKIYNEMREKLREEVIPKSTTKFSSPSPNKESNKIKSKLFLNTNMSDVLENSMSLFENNDSVHNYHSRPEFLKSFEVLQKQMHFKKQEIIKEDKKEIARIIKEFDYKLYAKRFSIDCDTVIASLIGAKNANKELIRHGMLKNLKM